MKIALPDASGTLTDYVLTGEPLPSSPLGADAARVVFAACHVVADPFTGNDPTGPAAIDWDATMAFRRHLDGLGLGIAEAIEIADVLIPGRDNLGHIAIFVSDFLSPEAGDQCRALIVLNITRDDLRASSDKSLDAGETDTACCAGNHCDFARQICHSFLQ